MKMFLGCWRQVGFELVMGGCEHQMDKFVLRTLVSLLARAAGAGLTKGGWSSFDGTRGGEPKRDRSEGNAFC